MAGCWPGGTSPSGGSVTYIVNGTAGRASMTYATAGGGTAQQSDRFLPWTYDFTAQSADFLYISAQNSNSSGCVTVKILKGSTNVKETQSCGAYVIATASGSY